MAESVSQNPLTQYSSPSRIPEMSINGITINKRYAFTGVIDTLLTSDTKYSAPQIGQTNPAQTTVLPAQKPPSEYWSSPKGIIGSPTIIGIQINLRIPNATGNPSDSQTQQTTFLNYISFKMLDVPANWTVYYRDPLSNTLTQLTDVYGNPVGGRTTGSSPTAWNLIEVYSQTVSTSMIEIRLDRNVKINLAPGIGTITKPVPYAFTLANVDLRLIAENDFGQVPENAILASVNSIGITEQYVKVQRDASQIQIPGNRTTQLGSNNYWRSEPQAVGNAVVCLYVDMGLKQTIDSLYLDPLYSGVKCNIYYSNDPTINKSFWCSRDQTILTQRNMDNPINFQSSGEQLWGPFGNTRTGAVFPGIDNPDSGLIAPGNLQVDGTQSWAMGLKFTPTTDILAQNSKLIGGQELISPSGTYRAVMQYDGNFVVYPTGSHSALWNTRTFGNSGASLIMQGDGNLVIYSAKGKAIWSTNTWVSNGSLSGSYLELQDNGSLVLYSSSGSVVWSSGATGENTSQAIVGTLINQVLPDSETNTVKLEYAINGGNITFTALINGTTISKTMAELIAPSSGWSQAPYTVSIGYNNTQSNNPYAFLYVNVNGVGTTSQNEPVIITESTPFLYDGTSGPDQGSGLGSPGVITLGNNALGGEPANGVMQDFWLRQDSITNAIFNAFVAHSRAFIDSYGAKQSIQKVPNTLRGDYKALLLARLNNENVYSGPSAEYYELKTWTPLQSDISLRKATFKLPEIQARYIKLEFTNLKAENYPLNERHVTRTTRFFPPSVEAQFESIERNSKNLKTNNYLALGTYGSASTIQLNSSPILVPTSQGSTEIQILNPPTQGELNASQTGSGTSIVRNNYSSIVDPTSSSAYLSSGPKTGPAQPYLTPRFTTTSVHNYNEVEIEQYWHQAYFVGIKALQFYKKSQTSVDDTEYYYDSCSTAPGSISSNSNTSIFDSEVPVGQSIIPWSGEQIDETLEGYQSTTSGQVLYTLPLTSFSTVSSLQFASTGSDWKSLQPADQALMTNANLGYVNQINIQNSIQVSAFQLRSGVWQVNPLVGSIPNNNMNMNPGMSEESQFSIPNYGMSTKIVPLPDTITDQLGMRVSAAARIYLPMTCDGTYTINLYAEIDGNKSLVATKSKILACNIWIDLELAWSIPDLNGSLVTGLQAEILQTNTSVSEAFYITMLSTFYNPVSWSWTTDKNSFYQITSTVNNKRGFATLNFVDATGLKTGLNTFFIRAKAHEPGAYIKSVLIAPKYPFNPYTPSANVNYISDPRTNENIDRVSAAQHPMFLLSNDFFPKNFSLQSTSSVGRNITP
jgi:hypothetical protein